MVNTVDEYFAHLGVDTRELKHFGVKGMKWGVRKDEDNQKSNRRVLLEGRYIAKGLTPKDAEIAADRRIRTEKTVAIVGAVTVAAVVAGVATRHIGANYVDVTLKQGTPLQHVTSTGDLKIKELPLFATFDKMDKRNIHALFPQEYQVDLKTTKDIMAPSNYKARKMLSEVLGKQKVMSKSEYARFNYGYFYNQTPEAQKVVTDFFGKIKAAGYNSVLDPKPGGYRVSGTAQRLKKPLIVLDGANTLVKVGQKAVDEGMRSEVTNSVMAKTLLQGYTTLGSTAAGVVGLSVAGSSFDRTLSQTKAIDNFIANNPSTTYTRSELASMLTDAGNGKYALAVSK